jgi:DNA-binding transcriptional regulator YdaS (Cro superfamily)
MDHRIAMTLTPEEMNAIAVATLAEAVENIGGQAATARLLGVSQPTVHRWLKAEKPVPAEYVRTLVPAGRVTARDLRPDLDLREPENGDDAAIDLEPVR